MSGLRSGYVTALALSALLSGCSLFGNADDFDYAADCETRMARGTPSEDLGNFKSEVRPGTERTEVFVTADYRPQGGSGTLRDYFHCTYNGIALTGDDRRPPTAQRAAP